MITHTLVLIIGFIIGVLVGRKNPSKASLLAAKGKDAVDSVKKKL